MRQFICFFFLVSAVAKEPSEAHLNLFYNDAVTQARNSVHGTQRIFETPFFAQHFILWDYCEDAPTHQSYLAHYQNLFTFVEAEGINKVIIFPKDPSAPTNAFFNITDQDPSNQNCLAYWINKFASKQIAVEILFDSSSFDHASDSTPTYSLPGDFYFLDLPQKMNWVKSLSLIVSAHAIQGVTIDPEATNSGGNNGYQQIINYMDQYRFDNGLPNITLGMAFGIDARTMTFANLSSFPLNPLYFPGLPASFPTSLMQSLPTWRAPTNNAPLLNYSYLEAYEPDFTFIFTKNLSPVEAADTFILALQDIPYKLSHGEITTSTSSLIGTYVDGGQFVSQGSITCTHGSVACSYSGSYFTEEIVPGSYLDFDMGGTVVPIGQVSSIDYDPVHQTFKLIDTTNGANVTISNQSFILSQFGVEILSGEIINTPNNFPSSPNMKIGAIDGPIPFNAPGYNPSLHQFNFLDLPFFTLTDQSFLGSEVVMKWTYPPITRAIASGINFLFSVQYEMSQGDLYFGNWKLDNYMAFIQHFLSQTTGTTPTNPIFTDTDDHGIGVSSTSIGIYDYFLLLNTNANPAQNTVPPDAPNPPPTPPNPWFPQFPSP